MWLPESSTSFIEAAVQGRKTINVAVFVAGWETYGMPTVVITQYKVSKDYDINFRYISLDKGNLCQSLLDLGADVRIIGGRIPKAYPPNLVKLIGIFFSHLRANFEIFRKIRAYLKETQPDLLYTHEVTEHIVGGFAAKFCGIKAVGHSHMMYNPKRNLGLSRVIVSILFNFSLDMMISVSNAARSSLWGPIKKKTYPIYVGREIQDIYQAGREMTSQEDCPAADLIYIGRLTPIKKQDILIEAVGILAREGLRTKTFLVSGGADDTNPYYLKLQKQISRLGLEDDIIFTGFVPEPYGMLTKAKVSVLCCTKEGCPNLVGESMACQTPIVVADAGGTGELVEDGVTGLKFRPDDPNELAECLRRLLKDERLRKKLAERGFAWANEKVTVDAHMAQLRQRFEQVIKK